MSSDSFVFDLPAKWVAVPVAVVLGLVIYAIYALLKSWISEKYHSLLLTVLAFGVGLGALAGWIWYLVVSFS